MPILTDQERLGTTLAGKYLISEILGSGGMGTVFLAEHEWTHRRVAVKLLKPGLATEPMVRERFLREARAAASLEHDNAVDVLDMGETEDGTVFLVLELLEGRTLSDLLAERGVLTVDETLGVMLPVIDALSVAHQRGFLHRDVKPENIFLTAGAEDTVVPKLLDFGLAKALDGASSVQTATGHVLGTPYYMSPEQAAGKRELTAASDVWSVGVVLFECLAGVLPFTGESLTSILLSIVSTPAPPLRQKAPDVTPAVADIVDRTLAHDAAERVASMDTLSQELRTLVRAGSGASGALVAPLRPSGLGIELPSTRLATPTPKPERSRSSRWPMIAGLGLLASLVLVGGGLVIASAIRGGSVADVSSSEPEAIVPEQVPTTPAVASDEPIEPTEVRVGSPPAGAQPAPVVEAVPAADETEPHGESARTSARPADRRAPRERADPRRDVSIRTEWGEESGGAGEGADDAEERPTVHGW